MNTKTFAQTARKLLLEGVERRILFWGFDSDGTVIEEPQAVSGGFTLRGEPFDNINGLTLWKGLKSAIKTKGIDVVIEETAYTWFNRIMALRIMAHNGYIEPQLTYVEGMEHTPIILQQARQGQCDFLESDAQNRLQTLLLDYSKEQDAFALLLMGYCHSNTMLNQVFGKIDDYTELLLPDNMLQDNSFLHLLNTTDAISDDDYEKVELIGWLYQFYISEKKDEVFASFKKNKKAEAKDIPAATQIFTPNWIVKYMVENTVGKIWLDKSPNSSLKDSMKHLVKSDNDTSNKSIISDVEELTLIDPACGSGHILVEGFELLYQMYMEEYYTPEEAVECILSKNLYGLDIDDRAAQLAIFAVLLKAAQKYRDVFTKGWMPQVYAMPEPYSFTEQDVNYFLGADGAVYTEELVKALALMEQSNNLGSIMKLELSDLALCFIQERYKYLNESVFTDLHFPFIFPKIKDFIPVLLTLTQKYSAVVTNPPYMGQKNMNAELKTYVNKHYPISKSDLFAVFMESTLAMNIDKGYMGMINQHSWMFLSSYEKLRKQIVDNYSIVNMLHLGPRAFEELSGEVVQATAFVLQNGKSVDKGTYFRLVDYKSAHEKEQQFLSGNNCHLNIYQTNFAKIPGNPIAYWVSEKEFNLITNFPSLGEYSEPKTGLQTSDNNRFLRLWYEVIPTSIGINLDKLDAICSNYKWFPHNKGGGRCKWYGNNYIIVNFKNDGQELKHWLVNNPSDPSTKHWSRNLRNYDFYFRKGITWGAVSSDGITCRYSPQGFLFDTTGPMLFTKDNINFTLALLNSNVFENFLKIFSQTLSKGAGDFSKVPFVMSKDYGIIVESIVNNCISVARKNWDSIEISWDFNKLPLLTHRDTSIESCYSQFKIHLSEDFFKLHRNEEELNRIFIDIYGLQDELTPEVELKDITILQNELDRKALTALEPKFRELGKEGIELPIKRDEVLSQFISYAIGLFMGRYRLDKPGLNIAHPNPTEEELASYNYNEGRVTIDEDAIIPLMGNACSFPDDAFVQFNQLLDTIWGHDVRTENINFIQECLNKDLDKFLVKDFFKYHCSMYKKKPIYWLFASKKGAFQVLVYMHRMNAFTVEKIRANYLLPHIKHLSIEYDILKVKESSLSTIEAKRMEQLRKDIVECEAYDMELHTVADAQITIDLDDGVTVNYDKFKTVLAKIK